MRLSQPQQMMASDRHIVDEAYAGDIIGVFDPASSPSEIRSVCRAENSHTREFRPSRRSILQECASSIR